MEPLEQEHEIRFQSDSDESDRESRTTNSGQQYTLAGIEIAALSLEDSYTEGTCKLGTAKTQAAELQFWDQAMEQEEFILFSLTKAEKLYTTAGQAFGYRNKKNKYMLVPATLADEKGEIFLVGATGHSYGNTAELNVMNYRQTMATVDKEEWKKKNKVEHDKMVKYNMFKVINRKDIPPGTKLFDST